MGESWNPHTVMLAQLVVGPLFKRDLFFPPAKSFEFLVFLSLTSVFFFSTIDNTYRRDSKMGMMDGDGIKPLISSKYPEDPTFSGLVCAGFE